MKKIILTTAISALLSTTAFAGITGGDIDFEADIVNPSCEVTIDGSKSNFKIDLGVHERSYFGAQNVNEKIDATKKPFDIIAKGFDCNTAKLTLKAHTPHVRLDGVYWGFKNGKERLPFYMENSLDNSAVKLDGVTEVQGVGATATNPANATSTYSLNSYLFNDGSIPALGAYTARVAFIVENN